MGVDGQRHAPSALPPERPGTHCIGGWVGLRTGLDGYEKSRLPLGFDSRTVQPVRYPGPGRWYKNIFAYGFLLGDFPKQLRKATVKLMMFVRISAWNSATATEEIFVSFHVRTFYQNLSFPSNFGYNRTKIIDILPEDRPKFMIPRRHWSLELRQTCSLWGSCWGRRNIWRFKHNNGARWITNLTILR